MGKGAFLKSAASSSPTRPPQTPGIFVRPNDFEQARRPYGLLDVILGLPGQLYLPEGLFVQPTTVPLTTIPGESINDVSESDSDLSVEENENSAESGVAYEKQQDKKQRQWQKWSQVTIPAMLKPYLKLLQVTDSLRDLDHVRHWKGCTGCSSGRMLEVSCIYFDSMLK